MESCGDLLASRDIGGGVGGREEVGNIDHGNSVLGGETREKLEREHWIFFTKI